MAAVFRAAAMNAGQPDWRLSQFRGQTGGGRYVRCAVWSGLAWGGVDA